MFVILLLLARKEWKANPPYHYVEMQQFKDDMESVVTLKSAERLNLACRYMQNFLGCVNNVLRKETSMDIKEFDNYWVMNTEYGMFISSLIAIHDFIEELCTEGTHLHDEYLMLDGQCRRRRCDKPEDVCQGLEATTLEIYRELPGEKKVGMKIDKCVKAAYFLNCIGAALHEGCGVQLLERDRVFVKGIGFFQNIRSSKLMQTLNTTFVESLNTSGSKKSLYHMIFSSKKSGQ